ncbi:hypothetical protein GCM10025787_11220 [Saccharopolyspora rosea]
MDCAQWSRVTRGAAGLRCASAAFKAALGLDRAATGPGVRPASGGSAPRGAPTSEPVPAPNSVGFARWRRRGGEPEFFGATALPVSAADVREAGPTGAERLYSTGVALIEIDLAAVARPLRDGADILSAGSLPVLLAIRAAALRTPVR